MKKRHLMMPAIFALAVKLSPASAQTNSTEVDVPSQVNHLLQQYGIPGAAVLVLHHQQIQDHVYGYSDAAHQIPVTSTTLFELGSVTKTMTALLLAEQVNAGKLQLTQNWTALMPMGGKYSADLQTVSLLNLATHTSSLPKDAPGVAYNSADNAANQHRLDQFLARWKAPYPIGSHTQYSNLGYSMLGRGLAAQQGKSLEDLMRAQIFSPLHMTDARLDLTPKMPEFSRYADGYTSDDKPARTPAAGMLPGAWAAKVTIADMKGYLQAAVGDPSVPAELLQAMRLTQTGYFNRPATVSSARIGLAWTIIPLDKITPADWHSPQPGRLSQKTPAGAADKEVRPIAQPRFDGDCLIDKTGSTDGFRAYIGVIPSSQTGIVILTNKFTYNYGALRDLGRGLLLQIAGLAKPDPPPGSKRSTRR